MICELVVKCATLIAVIHGLRFVGRRAGPRASGLILGLPSSTAVLLVLCGRDRGIGPAVEMADAGLLGLVAAVAMPLAYARAVRWGWSLAAAMAAAGAAYVVVASGLGFVHPPDFAGRLVVSIGSIVVASLLASRIGISAGDSVRAAASGRSIAAVRTIIPLSYVGIAGIVGGVASPRWAGLVGTFPSMSAVALAVTHLEEGSAAAGRIARTLPAANLSTAAFLAAFRLGCPALGLAWGGSCAYLAALLTLAAIERIPRSDLASSLLGRGRDDLANFGRRVLRSWRTLHRGLHVHVRPGPRPVVRVRSTNRRHFAPRVEILPC
jgi:hypothetical protein